jgi:hypothetical protein
MTASPSASPARAISVENPGRSHRHGADGIANGALDRRLWAAAALNIAITLAEFLGGPLSGSLALLSGAAHNPKNKTPLLNKLAEVQAHIASGTPCDLCQALSKLIHDVLPKTDGETPPPDWVTDADAQAELEAEVRALIDRLQSEVDAQGGCGGC